MTPPAHQSDPARRRATDPAPRTHRSTSRAIRADFPILQRTVRGKPLVYLDNAATTQKPQAVLDALMSYYTDINANVHRGVHELSGLRDRRLRRRAREDPRVLQRVVSVQEIVFTRNATEGINLVAYAFVRPMLAAGDEVRRSRRWSTTPTSCRGSWCARSAARGCAWRRSTTAAR